MNRNNSSSSIWQKRALRHGLAFVAVAAGFGLRSALTAWIGPGLPTYITFYPAVMVAALLAGFGPGLLATALTGLSVAYWVLPPEGFAISSTVDRVGLVLFAGMGLFMSTIAELYRRDRRKAAAYDQEMALRESRETLRQSEAPLAASSARRWTPLSVWTQTSGSCCSMPRRRICFAVPPRRRSASHWTGSSRSGIAPRTASTCAALAPPE